MILCAPSSCTPPILAAVCGVGVCSWVRFWAAPRHTWLGCCCVCVCVCVFVCALRLYAANPGWGVRCWCVCLGSSFGCGVHHLPVPRHSWLGFVVCGFGVDWHLFLFRGPLRVVRAARVCGTQWPLLLRTCPCALVVAGGPPLWRASSPRIGAPRPVRCGRSRCLGRLSGRRRAFPHPGGLRIWIYRAAARGTWRPAVNQALCPCRRPLPRQGRGARSALYLLGGPRPGCPWRVPPALVLGCLRCGGLPVWTGSLMRPVSRIARLSTRDSAGAPGLFAVAAHSAPFGSEDATLGSRACVRVRAPLGRVGQASFPGAFWCPPPFPVAGLGTLFVCWAPSGLGLPCLWLLLFFFPFVCLRCHWRSVFPSPGCLGPWHRVAPPPPPFFSFLPPPSPFFLPVFLLFFVCFVFCLFASFFFPAAVCPLCGVWVVCVSRAVGCVGVCCCGRCAPAGVGLRLRCVVRCSLVVPVLCVALPVMLRVSGGAVLAAFLFPVLPLVPCLCALPSLLFRGACGLLLPFGAAVGLPCCVGSCRAVSPCVGVCCVGLFGVVFCPLFCGAVWCCPTPPLRVLCGVFSFGCVLFVLPWLVVVPCVMCYCASCPVVLRSVVCLCFA